MLVMLKKVFSFYKIPLLLSLVLAIVLCTLNSYKPVTDLIQIFLGSFLGAFLLDSEYFLYAYIFEPQADFSKTLLGFLKHGDLLNALSYLNYHKDEVKEKSVNSAIFQIVLALLSISIVFASTSMFIKALAVSMFASSIYKFAEAYYKGDVAEWFWAFKKTPEKSGLLTYTIGMLAVLVFCLYFLR